MKRVLISLAMLLSVGCAGQAEWRPLSHLTSSERESASYKFLVGKFGADHLMVECDPEMGDEDFLWNVMDDFSDRYKYGETLGHGATLQNAIDDAASEYISGPGVRRLEAEIAQEDKAQQARIEKLRKKCQCGNP